MHATLYRDVLFNILFAVFVLTVLMLPNLNPPTDEAKSEPPGNIIVHITWPPGNTDVDLWVDGPGELAPVGYSNKGDVLWNLLRDDLGAMAEYLKSLPASESPQPDRGAPASQQLLAEGKRIYDAQCVDCHGADGKGRQPAYPPLAGNRAVTLSPAVNAIRMVLNGGFPPGTAGNPRPYGMPPYGHELSDAQVAAVLSYVRGSWGNAAPPVTSPDVNRYRAVPLD